MKSIKEKAEEYSRCIASSEYTREDFESGANYVLDAIEKVFAENTNPISPDSHVLYCVRDRINQLKGNK